ncbi:hypothetical protein BDP27DRAFT_1321271 [Rhodocollybia butyracea]|uniref:Zn(2)-C6 fungal-type domain-containing protein n=1 Tax=Rhodocollybia butyracea TaxID=206335 RepID=A0A9P5PZM4_9AGAR|nr:hypothetical protein BDP27DRAFT_1321271 [Rhodocollybia butyracea]
MGASLKEKDKDGKGTTGKRKPGRIPTSCAECRRLKLRCDKQVPCGKCVSRGCAAICPDGEIPSSLLILANTEQLHERIENLCHRIRELESALRGAHTQLSQEEHPLLQPDLLQLKAPDNGYLNDGPIPQVAFTSVAGPSSDASALVTEENTAKKPEDENLIDAFGTLSIRENGETQFLGQTARSEYLIRALSRPQKSFMPLSNTRLSSKILHSANICRDDSGPDYDDSCSQLDVHEIGREVFSLLPPLSEAIRLCELYLEHGKFISFDTLSCQHSLSLLFMVFALASLFDPDLPSCSIPAQEYFYLAKAAIGPSTICSHTTLKSIWCMVHAAQFLEFSDWEAMGSAAGWAYVGNAVRMSTSVRNLNSSRWKLPDDIQQKRYRLFWASFNYGRPPSLSRPYIDCPLPKDTEEVTRPDGEKEIGFHYWTWQFTAFMHPIMEQTFGSSRPGYNTIIELDRRIRDFPVPVNLRVKCGVLEPRPEVYMQRFIVLNYKENTLLHLHRAYLAQALQDSPDDLTSHKYVGSVIATFRSAWRLSKTMQIAWKSIPQLLSRYHLAWSQLLSAAIVMCILVTRAPNSKMTKASVEELDSMASLFEEAATTSRSAAIILDTMRNLRRKAQEAVDSANASNTNGASPAESTSSGSRSLHSSASYTNTYEIDQTQEHPLSTFELDRLGGRTHLLAACSASRPPDEPSLARLSSASPDGQPLSSFSPSLNRESHATSSRPPSNPPNERSHLPSFHRSQAPPQQPQNLHPVIARDIQNMDMDLGGIEFHFFEPSSTAQAEIQQPFEVEPSPHDVVRGPSQVNGHGLYASSQDQEMASDSALRSLPHSHPHSHPDPHMVEMSGVPFGELPMGVEDMNLHMGFNSMGDISGVFGNQSMFPLPATGAFSPLGHPQTNTQLPFGAPILDATWQSFVEQLGF